MAYHATNGNTGTMLDDIIDQIYEDSGLTGRAPFDDVIGGAVAANHMNNILAEAISTLDLLSDGTISVQDVQAINTYIRDNHLARWTRLHGDDENGEETGFHLIQGDGGTSTLENRALINTVFDGIYHLGFETSGTHILNEDGDENASLGELAHWLTYFTTGDMSHFFGTSGDDWVVSYNLDDTVTLGAGNDGTRSGNGNDKVYGQAGDDWMHGGGGNDLIAGGTGNDGLVGGTGRDTLYGGAGDDHLQGERGNDKLLGGDGNDRLKGEHGDDELFGNDGDDSMAGGNGHDVIDGGAGADWVQGGSGNDIISGGNGNDSLYGSQGRDEINGGNGLDKLVGGRGNDTLYGGNSDDTLYGQSNKDMIAGGNGNDRLYGGGGNDLLLGGAGDDTLTGDFGADKFLFRKLTSGSDTIRDFHRDQGDQIVLHSGMVANRFDLGYDKTLVTLNDATTGEVYGSVTVYGPIRASDIVIDDAAFF